MNTFFIPNKRLIRGEGDGERGEGGGGVIESTHTRHRSDRSYRTDTDQMRAAIEVDSTFFFSFFLDQNDRGCLTENGRNCHSCFAM